MGGQFADKKDGRGKINRKTNVKVERYNSKTGKTVRRK